MINVIPTIVLAALTGDAEGQTVLGGEERSLSLGSSFVDLLTGGGKKPAKPAKDITTTDEGPTKGAGAKCKFPFKTILGTFDDCIPTKDYPGKAWCATETNPWGYTNWGICPVTACTDSSYWGEPNKVDCICKASSSQNKDISTVCSKGEYCRHGATREKDLCSTTPECTNDIVYGTSGNNLEKCDCMLNGANTITNVKNGSRVVKNGSRVFKHTCNAGWKCDPYATKKEGICTQAACNWNSCKVPGPNSCVGVKGFPTRMQCKVNKKKAKFCTDVKTKEDGRNWSMDACGKVTAVRTQKCGRKYRNGYVDNYKTCSCRTRGGSVARGWVVTKRSSFGNKIKCERRVRCDVDTDYDCSQLPFGVLDQSKSKN